MASPEKIKQLDDAVRNTNYERMLEVLEHTDLSQINQSGTDASIALITLIRHGKHMSSEFYKCVQLLIDKNININLKDKDNRRTALSWAAEIYINEQMRKVRLLIVHPKSSSRFSNRSNLCERLQKCQEEGNRNYISGINKSDTIDVDGTKYNALELCFKNKWLIPAAYIFDKYDADSKITVWRENEKENQDKILELILREDEGIPQLLCTILKKFQQKSNHYPACYRKIMDVIKNKNLNDLYSNLNGKDFLFRTPLHYAIRYADDLTVVELLSYGASLGSTNISAPVQRNNCYKYWRMFWRTIYGWCKCCKCKNTKQNMQKDDISLKLLNSEQDDSSEENVMI
ncbi:uncharacterized protein LOC115875190 isoform X2 [Sitophilus oryzae]|uniref:Uncharacterized protein LOC115875190 isoform X2 n=1 Tax=Sitophilus oryzae TaxID=7048 RepID=A0A6J2X608_SITOR|nr:uncharacterized protein LOC115875190 isoform X2 [Sitophilus oryzae]